LDATDLTGRGEPYLNEQTIGGFLALGLFLLWRARGNFGFWISDFGLGRQSQRLRKSDVFAGNPKSKRPEDTRNPKFPALVFVLAVAVMIGFLSAAGLGLELAVGMVALYFLMVVVITRVRAEAGFPWAYGPDR